MATNGESAARWLKDNADQLPLERIEQVRNNVQAKLDGLDDQAPSAAGLLEALEVLDHFLLNHSTVSTANPGRSGGTAPAVTFDPSPLTPAIEPIAPLDPSEKRERFRQLLAQNPHCKPSSQSE
ncbi:hypothetical protein [Aestuariirhabdus litorea]|uniref:Uncharacterized protein n=1 Tax=Aestuariirhabdus litorea TaxID=2528527 RepID=A0A3P3VU72_9GAMM|nr:hypothetical protein [Aestuariirhabdus litorea]RRJ84313.1 hypothetical protein D0544_04180 [Aestuariirhabdus litorea]RWW97536.1 hypothetical protein DZC74_04180 [Endozoicomonadaceae bacterium GTF-13]